MNDIKCACIRLDRHDCLQARFSLSRCESTNAECGCPCHDDWENDAEDWTTASDERRERAGEGR